MHEGAPPVHHVPPDGSTTLVVACRQPAEATIIASGPWLEPLPVPIQPGDRFVGLRLQPGATPSFLGIAAAELRNRARPVATLLGLEAAPLARSVAAAGSFVEAVAIFDIALAPRCDALARPDPLASEVVAYVVLSRGAIEIATIAQELGVSPRTLLRRFRAATGVSPKQFARVIRFRFAAVELLAADARLSTVAAMAGYADQPHLTRDWADLLGITPKRLLEILKTTAHHNVTY